MDEEEIEKLITDLRAMMIEAGFGWAVEEAEFSLVPDAGTIARAEAHIDAAEGVSVDLAEIEIRALGGLGVEEIQFELDDDDGLEGEVDGDGVAVTQRERRAAPADIDGAKGRQRRAILHELAAQRSVFDKLRRSLGGDE